MTKFQYGWGSLGLGCRSRGKHIVAFRADMQVEAIAGICVVVTRESEPYKLTGIPCYVS